MKPSQYNFRGFIGGYEDGKVFAITACRPEFSPQNRVKVGHGSCAYNPSTREAREALECAGVASLT